MVDPKAQRELQHFISCQNFATVSNANHACPNHAFRVSRVKCQFGNSNDGFAMFILSAGLGAKVPGFARLTRRVSNAALVKISAISLKNIKK